MSGDGTFGGFGHDFAEEAMTANLEQEAQKAADAICSQSPQPMYHRAVELAYLSAAEPREKEIEHYLAEFRGATHRCARLEEEIAALREELEHAKKDNDSLRQANEIEIGEVMPLHIEIASLRSRVALLEEYAALLVESERIMLPLLVSHGCQFPKDMIDRGERLRSALMVPPIPLPEVNQGNKGD